MMVIQAKFRVGDPETFLRLQIMDRLAGFWLSTAQINQVFDTYMDTRGRRLLTAGYCFRKREQFDGLMMTLATLSKRSGAVHRWEKWEILLASDRRLEKWPNSKIRTKMIQLIGKEHLLPLASLQQTRIVRGLCRGNWQVAEVWLDSVNHKIGVNQHVHFEMEVEFIPPTTEDTLLQIVDYLEEEWNLLPEYITKFEHSYPFEEEMPAGWFNETLFRSANRLRRIV